MREIVMNASWLASVVLVLVGLIKLPFSKFKEKHPKWYKVTFFLLSLVLVVVGSIIVELYIFDLGLATWTYASLLVSTGFIVFGGYSAYECTGVKEGVNKLVKKGLTTYSDTKLGKIIKKAGGIDRINAIDAKIKTEQAEKEKALQEAKSEVPTADVEVVDVIEPKLNATIIEEPNNN